MKHLNAYQARQLFLLKNRINKYEIKEISLKVLCADIEFLLNVLEDDKDWPEKVDKDWIEQMRSLNITMDLLNTNIDEDGYYVYVRLTEKDIEEINSILNEMKKLIDEQLLLIPDTEW
jgi:hypothetical protein